MLNVLIAIAIANTWLSPGNSRHIARTTLLLASSSSRRAKAFGRQSSSVLAGSGITTVLGYADATYSPSQSPQTVKLSASTGAKSISAIVVTAIYQGDAVGFILADSTPLAISLPQSKILVHENGGSWFTVPTTTSGEFKNSVAFASYITLGYPPFTAGSYQFINGITLSINPVTNAPFGPTSYSIPLPTVADSSAQGSAVFPSGSLPAHTVSLSATTDGGSLIGGGTTGFGLTTYISTIFNGNGTTVYSASIYFY